MKRPEHLNSALLKLRFAVLKEFGKCGYYQQFLSKIVTTNKSITTETKILDKLNGFSEHESRFHFSISKLSIEVVY